MTDREQPSSAADPVATQRRAAVRLIEEAAAGLELRAQTFCGDWIVRLIHRDGRARLVWGYNFDLNPSAGAQVAKDKAATFEVLRAAGVAAVEHRLFLRADLDEYVGDDGNWRAMLAALDDFGGEAVIKPTDGSGGAGVSRVRSRRELEQAAGALWQRTHAICLSPFIEAAREVRHILLDGEARIIYEKQIDALVGDGRSSIGQLILARLDADPLRWSHHLATSARRHGELAWDHIPAAGQRLPLAWKHNLRGARAVVPQQPDNAMLKLARRAADSLGLRLCAVDVIEPAGAREPIILEVNAGLMLERYVEQIEDGWQRALELMRDVLVRMFEAGAPRR